MDIAKVGSGNVGALEVGAMAGIAPVAQRRAVEICVPQIAVAKVRPDHVSVAQVCPSEFRAGKATTDAPLDTHAAEHRIAEVDSGKCRAAQICALEVSARKVDADESNVAQIGVTEIRVAHIDADVCTAVQVATVEVLAVHVAADTTQRDDCGECVNEHRVNHLLWN
ncbi:MAG TPA: hypothetical protein VGP41_14025 [Candidatus Lustribacter sp.]|nr:hypothetical protein [Candidatus Lustribacter sp.]